MGGGVGANQELGLGRKESEEPKDSRNHPFWGKAESLGYFHPPASHKI